MEKFSITGSKIADQFLTDNDVTSITLFDLKTFKLTTIYSGSGEGGYGSPTSFSYEVTTGD